VLIFEKKMSDTSIKPNCTNGSTSAQMRGLINEFKQLYQNKLKKLESQQQQNKSEEATQLKMQTLESYVKDLLEQNDVLVQTIDELEKEANSRVLKLEIKLQSSINRSKVTFFFMNKFFSNRNFFYCRYDELGLEC
jgi:hypothetical protein